MEPKDPTPTVPTEPITIDWSSMTASEQLKFVLENPELIDAHLTAQAQARFGK